MNLLRALRSLRRRHLVVPAAAAAIVLTASVPAWADNPVNGDDERGRKEAHVRRDVPKTKPIAFTPAFGPRHEGGFDVGAIF